MTRLRLYAQGVRSQRVLRSAAAAIMPISISPAESTMPIIDRTPIDITSPVRIRGRIESKYYLRLAYRPDDRCRVDRFDSISPLILRPINSTWLGLHDHGLGRRGDHRTSHEAQQGGPLSVAPRKCGRREPARKDQTAQDNEVTRFSAHEISKESLHLYITSRSIQRLTHTRKVACIRLLDGSSWLLFA